MSNEDKINDIVRQLNCLTIEQNRIQEQQRNLRIRLERQVEGSNVSSNGIVQVTEVSNRDGKKIRGDIVRFLTQGAYPSTEGEVISVDRQWVISMDSARRRIRRAPFNVCVMSRDGNNTNNNEQ